MTISERDLDALRRALLWGEAFQKRESQLKLFPETMPAEGTPAWLALAERLAALAQSHNLGLRPWQCPPIDVDDDAVADLTGWACKPEEIALRQKMRDFGILKFEPDPAAAIATAAYQTQRAAPLRRKSQLRK
jgi:hypothetical protein